MKKLAKQDYNPGEIEKKWPRKTLASIRGKQDYDHRAIEIKWQKHWEDKGLYKAIDFDQRPKKYILFEFPYPSGEKLHIGHAFSFTGTDVLARFNRAKGFNVLIPIGWDAFGLPAENYAIRTGINPMITTAKNIANSRLQAKRLALSVDWKREISTIAPKYYRWTQWIFLQWYKKGLAYKAEMPVNWCPECKIGLANEEVLGGNCERCGAEVTQRRIRQWVVKITAYADRLIKGLEKTAFIEKVKAAQINWIGRSEGVEIDFETNLPQLKLKVFTTALDTIFGTAFIVVAPELAKDYLPLIEENKKLTVSKYIENSLKRSELERQADEKVKTGIDTGIKAINPFNGEEIPVFVADYILAGYGTGVVMGVPGHDARDYEFAKKYKLPIKIVIKPAKEIIGKAKVLPDGFWDYPEILKNVDDAILVDSGSFTGLTAKRAKEKLEKDLVKRKIGKRTVNYHLRDWIFSRQHYWGEPIPIIFCEKCGEVPVPEKDLPVELPKVENYKPTETGESPLAAITDWVNTKCPKCGGPAKRETDTMPNWAGSDWYYLAYPLADKLKVRDSKKGNIFADNLGLLSYWLPVDVYVGGDEHNTLHLLYSRFTYQFLWDMGILPKEYPEPYYRRLSHGVILGPDGQRMSKSKGNVINPDEVWKAFGVDALRVYLMFMGPFESTMAWSQESLGGCYRFLKRVWVLANSLQSTDYGLESCSRKAVDNKQLIRKLHQTIKKVGGDIDKMKFNTAVAAMMEFINSWQDSKSGLSKEDSGKFLQILAPFAPYITEELWQRLRRTRIGADLNAEKRGFGFSGNQRQIRRQSAFESIHLQPWPKYDPELLEEEKITVVIQVNGKIRDRLEVTPDEAKEGKKILELALASPKIQKYFPAAVGVGKSFAPKTVFIPGKLLNFVL